MRGSIGNTGTGLVRPELSEPACRSGPTRGEAGERQNHAAQRATAWGLAASGATVAVASVVFGLYTRFPWFDEALHAYDFFALTLLVCGLRPRAGADRRA